LACRRTGSPQIDGNKLTIAFQKASEKKVVDSFVGTGVRPLALNRG
jgi:hypothetical protein